ncbi:MAG: serine/threonine protein kinase [Bradymonadia bacterium]|jgi:serine/threonine protein kinase
MVICESCQTVNHPSNPACTSCGAPLGLDPGLNGDPYIGRLLGHDRFRLESVVGSGELGMVYRGIDNRTQQAVAVKIVHPDVAATHGAELLRSASSVARLRHAKIAAVLAAAREPDGTTFIVTEFVEGETLKSMLGRVGPLGPRRAADILFQLASALAPFHRAGRPHANLKPENVFLAKRDDGSDFVKIVDAGSPDLFGVQEINGGHVVIGNPKYFSPEQVLGEPVGLPSDLFTLGIIGYQLLSGALPFFGATPDQLLDAIVNNLPTPIEKRVSGNLPSRLARVIEECLAKLPDNRPKDLRQVATMLASVIKTTQVAPKRGRKPFGMGGDGPSTVVANIKTLQLLEADDDDDDATIARVLGADVLAALIQQPALADVHAGPDPETVVRGQTDSIPEPLMFTGAFNNADIKASIAQATAAQKGVSPPPPPPPPPVDTTPPSSPPPSLPDFGSDLAAALADASADVPAPAKSGEEFDPFASLPVERPSGPPRASQAAAQSGPSESSPNLASAILDAMDDVRPTLSKAAPSVVAPLATAADFKAIAPSQVNTASSLDALPPAPPTRNTRWLVVLTCLLLAVGVAAFVWVNYLEDSETAGNGQRSGRAVMPRTTGSAASVESAGAQAGASVAAGSTPSAGLPSVPSDAPESVGAAGSNSVASAKSAAPASAKSAAPATAKPAAGPYTLTLRSSPKGANIYEGAKKLGTAPVTVTLKPGDRRRLSFRLAGHDSKRWTITHSKFVERVKNGRASAGIRLNKKALENPYKKKLENPY